MQVLLLQLTLQINSSHSKRTQINPKTDWLSHCTDQSHLPLPASEKSKSSRHSGSRGIKRQWPFALLYQWHEKVFGTDHACDTNKSQ